jgi:hypothetical protein
MNAKREEVTTFDLASRMVDLAPKLTKESRVSASTSAYSKPLM